MATRPRTRKIGRLSEIAQVAVRHGFGYFFERHKLTDLLPWTARVESSPSRRAGSERGRHLREMLDELGPTFVKFGQLLSTRPDVVPPDIVAELRGLQDDVTPFPFAQVREVVEAELGLTLEQAFLEFDEPPIAAASIGQVHRAVLPNGDEVVVKVQRPNAPRQIESDLALLYQAARMIKERVRALDFIDANDLVDEFARFIRQELDYKLEARHADTFRRNFADSDVVVVPKVYWDYSGVRMLTLEFLEGVQLADLELETTAVEARRELAYRVTETWMEMIFRHGFFHGDPHPGERARARRRPDRPRRLRPRRQAHRRGHGAADAPLHRRRDRERRRAAAPARRARRPLSEGARGRVRGRAARALLPLLRREPRRDRPDPGDPRGLRADLLDEPAPADAVRAARQGDRHARRRRRRALPGVQRLRGRAARTRAS